nr:hypothetical protein [Candidatus Chloroploca sp. Khr17]
MLAPAQHARIDAINRFLADLIDREGNPGSCGNPPGHMDDLARLRILALQVGPALVDQQPWGWWNLSLGSLLQHDPLIKHARDRMIAQPFTTLAQDPEQHRIALGIRHEPALAVRKNPIRNVPTAPLALLGTKAMALVGALARLIDLPLGQHAADTALQLTILRGLLLRLTDIEHLDTERLQLRFELAALHIVAMAAVNTLDAYPVKLTAAGRREQLLELLAAGRARARTGLVDELGDDHFASALRLGTQAGELVGDADAVLDLIHA